MAKRKINKYVFKPGISYLSNNFPNAYTLFKSNLNFIQAELTAFLNQEILDAPKCERDIGYIVDGIAFDVVLNTNYNAVFLGLTEYNSLDISPTVIRTIERARDQMLSLGNVIADAGATETVTDGIAEIIDIATNGRGAADTIFYTNPSNATANVINAKNRILANRDWFAAEVNAWVSVNYPDHDHDVSKCTRDVKYAIDSLVYDLLYGGNSATYDSAKFFFYTGASGITLAHKEQTVAAYGRLATIVGQTILGLFVVNSAGNTLTQDLSGDSGTSAEVSTADALIQIVADVVDQGTGALPANRLLPNLIGADPGRSAAKVAIDSAKTTIIANSVAFSGYTYNLAKCERDLGYVLDAYLYDLRYGGNNHTRKVVAKYWDGNVAQVDGNRLPELDGHAFVGELITQYIFTNTPYDKKQTLVNQVINTGVTAESGATSVINTLVGYTLDVIENGLSSLPALVESGVGYIKVQGKFDTSDFLLITNTTENEIIYSFNDPSRGGTVTVETDIDEDYVKFLQTTDGVSKIFLNFDTSAHSATDDLQIFVEEKEMRVRPYDFGTDAIERMRIAPPLSMLDADFEYGLQPTKWSAIATMRGYPSIYEVPGTETEVVSVITDASVGTDGVGASLITVTTVGAHGWEPGTPITIKGLEPGVNGSGRAEGAFVITTVPSPSSITFYAKGKVGSEGDNLATPYTQLRQAGFYTGASVGLPTFDILSNGSAGTMTAALSVAAGEDTIPFSGNKPELGAPLVGNNILLGSQVTSVVGDGGVVVTPQTTEDTPSGSTDLVVFDPSNIEVGLVIDRGDGFGISVTNVVGNTVTFSGPITKDFVGNIVNYINVAGQNDTSNGAGALFDISRASGVYSLDAIVSPGSNYELGDTIIVLGTDLGGSSPEHDLFITVDQIETDGSILAVSLTGNAFDGNAIINGVTGNYNNGQGNGGIFDIAFDDNVFTTVTLKDPSYNNIQGATQGGTGTGAQWDVTTTDNVYTVDKDPATATGYAVNDVIVLSGSSFSGGVSPDNDLQIKITAVDLNGSPTTWNVYGVGPDVVETIISPPYQNSGSGTGAVFNVTKNGNVYDVIFSIVGSGFAPGDLLTVSGNDLNGTAPDNNCTIEILTVDVGGEILTYSVTGTATNSAFFASRIGTNILGGGASFDIDVTGTTYNVTLAQPGNNFSAGQTIVIDGAFLGGETVTHDLTITVDTVTLDASTGILGSINTFSISGNAQFGTTGYKVGDRILFQGATFSGGANGVNDLILQITNVGTEGNIVSYNIIGTAPDAVKQYNSPPSTTSGSGINADFNVTRNGTVYTATLNNPGTGYLPNDIIVIEGAQLGGATPANNLTITVNTVDTGGEILTYTEAGTANNADSVTDAFGTSLVGTGAIFTVTLSGGSYSVVPSSGGINYGPNQTFTVPGNQVNGASPTNDLTITVSTIDPATGEILSVSAAGSASTDIASFTNVSGSVLQPIGVGASFDITRNGTVYTPSINLTGSNYALGNRIIISGANLGGVPEVNDLIVTITEVSTSGSILAFTSSGVGDPGDEVAMFSAVTMSELTTGTVVAGTEITFEALATIEVNFTTAHGIVPGNTFITTIISDNGTNNHLLAAGSFIASSVPTSTSLTYQARAAGTIETSNGLDNIRGDIYIRPDSFFTHRPFDGGVQLGTGGPQYGAQAIRQSKKYIRYQSGKGIMYTTGALFAPSYDIRSATSNGIEVGSVITVTLDDNDHGMQVGGKIRLLGIETPGYNGDYTVSNIVSERVFQVVAKYRLGGNDAVLSFEAQASVLGWHGATVRSGIFDDQNGIYWEYDGVNIQVAQRTSTKQISGTVLVHPDENRIVGTNTRFRDQLKAGDRIVIRGMTHVVTHVISQNEMTVAPDYRGVNIAQGAKVCLVTDKKVRQQDFNLDSLDGNGPSGYEIDIAKMQMIGIQYSWYGAGFIDFMLRGSDGNFVFAHRMRNSNVNTEAFMRSGNLPVRYEVTNEGAYDKLRTDMDVSQTTVPLENAEFFPISGTVYIDNEIITYTNADYETNTLTGCTRAASLVNFQAGAQRSYSAGPANSHSARTGVILISNTITPLISHWGSAFLTDGGFDEDRGYIFSYAETGVTVSTTRKTAFLIRLAPSVSNAVTGDLGDRELLNRAQLLLQGIEVTSDTGAGGIVLEGVLNPQNYPTNPSNVGWEGLTGLAQGGQPSFAQIAPGGSIEWTTGATTTTVNLTALSPITTQIDSGQFRTNNGSNFVYVSATDHRNTFGTTDLTQVIGASISGQGIPTGTTITGGFIQGAPNNYGYYTISNRTTQNINQNVSNAFTITRGGDLTNRNFALISQTSWENSGAKSGDSVSVTTTNPTFPAGTRISSVSQQQFAGTIFYEVTFNNTFTGTLPQSTGTITLEFSQPAYAQPGETVFSFIAVPGERSTLELEQLKELTNTPLGGRGTFPNGPDVLAINVYKVSGADVTANIVLKWGEAQA